MSGRLDPRTLLRIPGPITPYPVEPSDEELAQAAGIGAERLLRFDMNTLGGGPLPGATRGLASVDAARLVEYGDQRLVELRAAIGAAIGVDARRVVAGAGADELIRLLTVSAVGAGDAVVVPTPTFGMFAVEAGLAGATVVDVERSAPDERQPVEDLRAAAEAAGARLVWLCSPNNPTGDAYPADEVLRLADGLPAIVVVDAVYQEFAEASARLAPEALSLASAQSATPNLVILRSLAKAYGLAGARVGYLVAHPDLADRLDAARLPLPISRASEAAALGVLAAPEVARARHREIVAERDRLAGELASRGWRTLPSVTNFFLARPPAPHAAGELAAALLGHGIALRSYPAGLLRDWLRITVRGRDDDDRLLAAADAVGSPA